MWVSKYVYYEWIIQVNLSNKYEKVSPVKKLINT